MDQTIGLAGRNYGEGRVAAFSKAFSTSDLTISGQGQDLLIKLFLNAVNWCAEPRSNNVILHDTGSNALNSIISSIVSSRGYSVTIQPPWYSTSGISGNTNCALRIIIPSYNANLGIKMQDAIQLAIINSVWSWGSGLLLGEWFHLLQSMPTRRSFSLSTDINQGLYTISPIKLDLSKQVVFTNVDELLYIQTQYNDSTSYTMPNRFSLGNLSSDVNFGGHISQLADISDAATVFWSTDVPAFSNTTTTTTSTTTTAVPDSDVIKMKLFNVDMVDYCGPQNWFLSGKDKDKFHFDGKHVYLTKKITKEEDLTFDIVAEDHFNTTRFNQKIQPVNVIARQCNSPITLPKEYTIPAYSYRGLPSTAAHTQRWGEDAITGIITNFSEWEATGKGTSDDKKIAYLGGMHSDMNTLWLQLNNAGTVSAQLVSSLREVGADSSSDYVHLYYIHNTATDDVPDIHPFQHTSDLYFNWQNLPNVTNLDGTVMGLTGREQLDIMFNVEDPYELDAEGNRVRGDAYLVLYLRKGLLRSDFDDRAYLTAWYGTISTTPPPTFTYNVFIINNVEGTNISIDSLSFTSVAKNTPVLPSQNFTIFSESGKGINSLSAVDNSEILTVNVGTITSPVSARTITVNLDQMPVNGGAATIILSGSTVSTTTTPPPPEYEVTINIFNNVPNTTSYLTTLSCTLNDPAGTEICCTVSQINSIFGYHWPTGSAFPTLTLVSSSPNNILTSSNVYRIFNSYTALYATNCVIIPEGGGTVNLRLDSNPPVPVTTTTTTTTSAPCSNLIQIICEQTLICNENSNGECQASLPVSQTVKYSTCCNIADEDILSIIRSANGASSTATLQEIYSSSCPSSTNTLLNPCQPKDQDGNCQETIHSVVIDEISCGSSDNPLP